MDTWIRKENFIDAVIVVIILTFTEKFSYFSTVFKKLWEYEEVKSL